MKIIVDSREQKPLEFKHEVIRECLPVGDYCVRFDDGTSPKVIFERKSKNDLFGTLSQGYVRFKCEIERAKEIETKLIIIVEGTLRSVLRGCSHSQRTPISIVYQLFTLRVRYNIETVFCTDREEMADYISHFYLAHEKEYLDNK